MPLLGPHDVHIWLSPYDQGEAALRTMQALLDQTELARGRAYAAEDDRRRHVVTRALVRSVLSRYAGVAPAAWRFAANPHGRPFIAAPAESGGLRFNVSHTRGLIALAVSRHRELGVDVECLDGRQVSPRMAQRFFSAREALALAQPVAGGPAAAQRRLLQYWTLKEAYVKARGQGLNFPFDRFSVDVEDEALRLSIEPALDDDPARWYLAQCQPAPGYLLALCAERHCGAWPQVTLYQATPAGEPAACPAPHWRSSQPA